MRNVIVSLDGVMEAPGGEEKFEYLETTPIDLERTRVIDSLGVTHLKLSITNHTSGTEQSI